MHIFLKFIQCPNMGNLPEEGDVLARFRGFHRDAEAQQFQHRRIIVWKTKSV
jgi:hypothetical protein